MKPILAATLILSLTMIACHKKAASPPITPHAYYWKLARCEFDGPAKLVYLPSNDTITRFDLLGNNQFLIYTPKVLLSQGSFTFSPDSILKFNVSPVLTADSSWRLPQEGAFHVFHGDSMVISSYPIPPWGLSTFTFVLAAGPTD